MRKPALSQAAMPPVEDRHVRIAEVGHSPGRPLAQASAVVAPHDACLASRHHVVGQHLDAPQRHARGHENVALAERQLLAGIEESDFQPVVQRRLEGPRVDALDRTRHRLLLLQGATATLSAIRRRSSAERRWYSWRDRKQDRGPPRQPPPAARHASSQSRSRRAC